MDAGTLVTLLVVALVILVLIFLLRAAGAGRRRPQLRALPTESRDRYIHEWDEIETKFVDSPEQAVREAETLLMSVLRERGHPLTDRDLPQEMQRAHRLAYATRDKTEGMRQALVAYRSLMVKMVGPEGMTQVKPGRREMA